MAYAKIVDIAGLLALSLALAACGGSSAGPAAGSTAGSGEPAAASAPAPAKTGTGTPPSTGAAGTPTSSNTVTPTAGSTGASSSPSTGTSPAVASGGRAAEPQGGSASPAPQAGAAAGGKAGAGAQAGSPAAASGERFSFFVTSFAALQKLSKSQDGFGGDLRYGEADGLAGADKICREIAELSMPGAGAKTWHAFLSVTKGADGNPVHAIDRVGEGPWYDRVGRLFAMTKADLVATRPKGGDPAIVNDFPNEDGVPNHAPDGAMQVDNHDMLTGTGTDGKLFSPDIRYTCQDWTSAVGADGTPRVGHSWPRSGTPVTFPAAGSGGPRMPPGGFPTTGAAGRGGPPGGFSGGDEWMSALTEAGCAAGASLVEMGGPMRNNPTVGSGGGYGGFYCFALTP